MAAARRPRILVVDDDPAIATTFETILSGEGYDVVTALEGARAVELVSREPCDVALLDLVMPGLDGLEVLRRFRERAPGCRVLILSAYIEPERQAEAFRLGAQAVLSKPPELARLLRLLADLTRPDAARDRSA